MRVQRGAEGAEFVTSSHMREKIEEGSSGCTPCTPCTPNPTPDATPLLAEIERLGLQVADLEAENDRLLTELQAANEMATWAGLFLSTAHPTPCPRCAARDVSKSSTYGWCAHCTSERRVEEIEKVERAKAKKRRWWDAHGEAWRTERKDALAAVAVDVTPAAS